MQRATNDPNNSASAAWDAQRAMDALIAENAVGKLRGMVIQNLTHNLGDIRIYLDRDHPVTNEEREAVLDRVEKMERLIKQVQEYKYHG